MELAQYSKAAQETVQNLRIIDDAFFRLMTEYDGVCQEILQTLLDMPRLVVVRAHAQEVIKSLHREVILDSLCILEDGKYANIEVQKGDCNDDVLRTRFHAASITSAYTPKGTEFKDVPSVTVLYITEYDALHNGQVVTRVKRCMQTPEGFDPVNDKEEILFANTAVRDGSTQSELLQLFLRRDVFEDERFPQISKAVKYYKQTEGGRLEMSMTLNDFKEMCVNDFCFNLVKNGSITVEVGAEELGITVPEFEQKMKEAGYKVPLKPTNLI